MKDATLNSGLPDSKVYVLPNIRGSSISPIPTQQNLLSLFQTLGYWLPAVAHCDRHICTAHTFTSGLFPLTGCTSSSLTMQTLLSLQKPSSIRSLTSPPAHSSLKCELHNLASVSKIQFWVCPFLNCFLSRRLFQSQLHYKFFYFRGFWGLFFFFLAFSYCSPRR